ncbi:hypothetical protein N7447_002285 [Penicillium robsamsonii]|uniref:uncharacterized protein n=1 Tax=Penicillium robsamsonii TaxID=1792511 RepID=UPI0025476D3F|nr:uncharacterized protein N7447_002285 [Penicillium robsamsonii]KAJ5836259.1 hypothetical protein N7447_002285 [Penicillium robsamsonii]
MSLSMVYVAHNASMQMPYKYEQESVLANGIYPVANAIEMDALLLLPGILLLSLSHPDWRVPELSGELDILHPRIRNPESRYGRQSSLTMAKDIATLLPSCGDRTLFDLGVMGVNGSEN